MGGGWEVARGMENGDIGKGRGQRAGEGIGGRDEATWGEEKGQGKERRHGEGL